MKNILYLILFLCSIVVFSCKKSSNSAPSIVGTWQFASMTSTTTTYSFGHEPVQKSYVPFDPVTDSLYITSSYYGGETYYISKEIWTFNTDGTYTIYEIYSLAGQSAMTIAISGTWEYISNTSVNNGFILIGHASEMLPSFNSTGTPTYYFTISSNNMVLENNYTEITGTDTTKGSQKVTFKKQ